MSKKSTYRPGVRTREKLPLAKRDKQGNVILMCPFCRTSHPIVPGTPSLCGTRLQVTAVQEIISTRTARLEKLVCVKCRNVGGGEMVKYMNGYIHLQDCMPDVQLLTQIPKYSRWAEFVFKFPERLRNVVEKLTGVAQKVNGLTPEGEETGEVEGYFFAPRSGKFGKAT